MKILAIETSCDETAVTVIEASGTYSNATFTVQGNALYSQAHKHAQYGGVYPTLAKREHAGNVVPLLKSALKEAKLYTETKKALEKEAVTFLEKLLHRETGLAQALTTLLEGMEKPSIDAIAVTKGPGLEPALWVGINFARALAYVWNIPILPVNHLEGHLIASAVTPSTEPNTYAVEDIAFPVIGLIISGGHTEFVYSTTWGEYNVIGATRDDSIGEAFDKVARLLGLPYPGGPKLSSLAEQGRKTLRTRPAHLTKDIPRLPRPMIQTESLDFSFSGLKTAVLYTVRDMGELTDIQKTLLAAEFEEAVADVILAKVTHALTLHPAHTLILGGGVSANNHIRKKLDYLLSHDMNGYHLRLPAPTLSTDNAVMIGMAGYFMHLRNAPTQTGAEELSASGNMEFE